MDAITDWILAMMLLMIQSMINILRTKMTHVMSSLICLKNGADRNIDFDVDQDHEKHASNFSEYHYVEAEDSEARGTGMDKRFHECLGDDRIGTLENT